MEDGGGQEVSTRWLHETHEEVALLIRVDDPLIPERFEDAIAVIDPEARAHLRAVLKNRTTDETSALETAVKREHQRQAFLARKRVPKLTGAVEYAAFETIETDGMRGEVGVHASGGGRSMIEFVKDGCLLQEFSLEIGIPGLCAVVEADFQPVADYSQSKKDTTMAQAIATIVDTLHKAMERFAWERKGRILGQAEHRVALGYVHAVATGTLLEDLLRAAGCHKRHAQRLVTRLGERSAPQLSQEDSPLRRLWVFSAADGKPLDLHSIEEQIGDGKLRVVSSTRPRLANPPHLIIRVRKLALETLETVLGEKRVRRYGDVYARLVRNEQWDRRAVDRVELPGSVHRGPVDFDRPGFRALVGLDAEMDDGAKSNHPAKTRIYLRQRELTTKKVRTPLAGLRLALDFEQLELSATDNDVADASSRRRIEEAAFDGIAALLTSMVDQLVDADHVGGVDSYALVSSLGLLFPTSAAMREYAVRREKQPRKQLRDAFMAYWDLLDRFRRVDHDNALEWAFGDRRKPGPKGKPPKKGQPRLAATRGVVFDLLLRFEPLRMFETMQGDASLGDLFQSVRAREAIYFIERSERPNVPGGPKERILLLNRQFRLLLERILGIGRMRSGKRVVDEWVQLRAFEQKPTLDAIALTEDMLVKVRIDEADMHGELGLPNSRPSSFGAGAVSVCRDRRVVCEIDPEIGFPVHGVLEGEFGETAGYSGLGKLEEGRIKAVCKEARLPLANALAQALRKADGKRASLLRAWVRRVMRAVGVGRGRRLSVRRSEPLHELVGLDVFPLLGGGMASAMELRRGRRGKEGIWVTPRADLPTHPDFPVVLAEEPGVYETVKAVFGPPESYEHEVDRMQAVQARKAAANKLPAPPTVTVAKCRLDRRGVVGQLWIDPSDPANGYVAAGDDGRVVEWIRVSETFPVSGAIHGGGVRVSDDWTEVELKQRQRDYLQDEAVKLYAEVLQAYEQHLEAPVDLETGLARPEDLRRVLADLIVRMEQVRRTSGKWKESRVRRLHRELREVALFRLSTGRLISAVVAKREFPAELAHLGLWEDDDVPDGRVPVVDDEPVGPGYVRSLVDGLMQSKPAKEEPPEPDPSPSASEELETLVPKTTATPEPEPSAAPPKPTPLKRSPKELLMAAVHDELRMVRGRNEALLSESVLTGFHFVNRGGDWLTGVIDEAVAINLDHPVASRALRDSEPLLISIVASSCYTTVNRWLEEVTDGDEVIFHRLHAQHVASAVRVRP